MEQYGDEETAKNVCGSMEQGALGRNPAKAYSTKKFKEQEDQGQLLRTIEPLSVAAVPNNKETVRMLGRDKSGNRMYLKVFLIDASINQNNWGVSQATVDRNIMSALGKPLVLYKNTGLETDSPYRIQGLFDHPPMDDGNLDHTYQMQDIFRIGTIIDLVKDAQGAWWGIVEIANPGVRKALVEDPNIPFFLSPAIMMRHVNQSHQNLTDWTFVHIAMVSRPAFGAMKAFVKGECSGDRELCVLRLRKASLEVAGVKTEAQLKAGENQCGFCTYKATFELGQQTKANGGAQMVKTKSFSNNRNRKKYTLPASLEARNQLIAQAEKDGKIVLATYAKARRDGSIKVSQEDEDDELVWFTRGDEKVCDECSHLEGSSFSFNSHDFPIPAEDTHPNCRCLLVRASGIVARGSITNTANDNNTDGFSNRMAAKVAVKNPTDKAEIKIPVTINGNKQIAQTVKKVVSSHVENSHTKSRDNNLSAEQLMAPRPEASTEQHLHVGQENAQDNNTAQPSAAETTESVEEINAVESTSNNARGEAQGQQNNSGEGSRNNTSTSTTKREVKTNKQQASSTAPKPTTEANNNLVTVERSKLAALIAEKNKLRNQVASLSDDLRNKDIRIASLEAVNMKTTAKVANLDQWRKQQERRERFVKIAQFIGTAPVFEGLTDEEKDEQARNLAASNKTVTQIIREFEPLNKAAVSAREQGGSASANVDQYGNVTAGTMIPRANIAGADNTSGANLPFGGGGNYQSGKLVKTASTQQQQQTEQQVADQVPFALQAAYAILGDRGVEL